MDMDEHFLKFKQFSDVYDGHPHGPTLFKGGWIGSGFFCNISTSC
jgi:hypothetical protein